MAVAAVPPRPLSHHSAIHVALSLSPSPGRLLSSRHSFFKRMPPVSAPTGDGLLALSTCELARPSVVLAPAADVRRHLECARCDRHATIGECDTCHRRCCRGCLEEATGQCWCCLGYGSPQEHSTLLAIANGDTMEEAFGAQGSLDKPASLGGDGGGCS